MKTVIRSLFFIIFSTITIHAQWDFKNPEPTGSMITGITLPNLTQHYAVTADGLVGVSTNGGSSWSYHKSGFDGILWGVEPVDAMTPVAFGDSGTIIISTDIGATWERKETGVTSEIYDIDFYDGNLGWACGIGGKVFRTYDGGETWSWDYVRPTDYARLNAVYFLNAEKGWLASRFGYIYTTADSGNTWTRIKTLISQDIYDIWFVNENLGFATADIYILKTTNSGADWTIALDNLTGVDGIEFTYDGSKGYCIGSHGKLYETADSGGSWQQVTGIIPDYSIEAVDIAGDNVYVGGQYGYMLRSTNGGSAWSEVSEGTRYDLYDIEFVDNNLGYAAGWYGTVLMTTDGGESWSRDIVSGFWTGVRKVLPFEAGDVLVAGDAGMIAKYDSSTTNYTIVNSDAAYDLHTLVFKDRSTGFAAGSEKTILKTTDGGESWTTVDPGSAGGTTPFTFYASCYNNTRLWLVGESAKVLFSVNNGVDWTERLIPTATDDLTAIAFVNDSVGYIGGYSGSFYKTTDGGAGFMEVATPALTIIRDIFFTDENKGYFITSSGRKFSTTDGGAAWEEELFDKAFVIWNAAAEVNGATWIAGDGSVIITNKDYVTGSIENTKDVPAEFQLAQNYPNPFNPATIIEFSIPERAYVKLSVYDILGRKVAEPVNGIRNFGDHKIVFIGRRLSSGVYFYTLRYNKRAITKTMIIIK